MIEEAVAVLPDDVNFRVLHADLLLHKMRDLQVGLPVMRQLVRDAINKNSAVWMAEAMRRVFDPANDNSHLPQAERFAMGNELSEHILAENPPRRGEAPKFLSYPAVAQYYNESGNKDRAIELIEMTLKSLDGPAPSPGQAHRGEAGRAAVPPEAPPSRRALDRGARRSRGDYDLRWSKEPALVAAQRYSASARADIGKTAR